MQLGLALHDNYTVRSQESGFHTGFSAWRGGGGGGGEKDFYAT